LLSAITLGIEKLRILLLFQAIAIYLTGLQCAHEIRADAAVLGQRMAVADATNAGSEFEGIVRSAGNAMLNVGAP
jgi:hypothetical protein